MVRVPWRPMTHVVSIAASVAAFLFALRVVPGFDFAYGRGYWKLALVVTAVGLIATYAPAVVRRAAPGRQSTGVAVVRAAGASAAGVTILMLVLGLISDPLDLGLNLAGYPPTFSVGSFAVVLLIGLIVAIVPSAILLVRGADRALDVPSLRAIAAKRTSRSDAVLLMFFLSGAAGLVYEVVWARQLVLVFGNTTQATSAILTGYFGGLALGSVLGGRLADRVRSPLKVYGIIELLLVGVVILTPVLFRGINELYRSSYPSFESAPAALALFRFALSILALAPATILMGATLPTLSRHLTTRAQDLSGNFARLYAMNTIGAVVGTSLAGFVLIEILGLTATLFIGAMASGRGGNRGDPPFAPDGRDALGQPDERTDAKDTTPTLAPATSPTRNLGLVVAFVSGVTSLGYQVLWTRLLSSGSGNSTYVFTLILSTFLVGIAIGAAVYARRLSRSARLVALLGIAQLTIAAIALVGLPILAGLVELPFLVRTLLVVLPATLVLGLTLPMASSLVGGVEEHVGRDAGPAPGSEHARCDLRHVPRPVRPHPHAGFAPIGCRPGARQRPAWRFLDRPGSIPALVAAGPARGRARAGRPGRCWYDDPDAVRG